MKICRVGAGSIGGLLGVKLSQMGEDVSLVARGLHLRAIQSARRVCSISFSGSIATGQLVRIDPQAVHFEPLAQRNCALTPVNSKALIVAYSLH